MERSAVSDNTNNKIKETKRKTQEEVKRKKNSTRKGDKKRHRTTITCQDKHCYHLIYKSISLITNNSELRVNE